MMLQHAPRTPPGRLYRQVFGLETPDVARAVIARRRHQGRERCLHPWVVMVRGKQLAERFATQGEALEVARSALRIPVSRQVDP